MPDYPRKRVVLNSIGCPTEETSDDGIVAAVAAYVAANPASGGPVDPATIDAQIEAYLTAHPAVAGDKGSTGDKGPQGDAGPNGQAGPDGSPGAAGAAGAAGATGAKGPTGDQGAAGADGNKGVTGDKGLTGDKGPAGDKGATGDKGSTGDVGPAGPAGDGWTYVRLASDFSTTLATAAVVPGLAFTPAASKRYEFEGKLRLRTSLATIGPRPGLNWPSAGITDGGVGIWAPNSATTEAIAREPAGVAAMAASTGVPDATHSWPGFISGEIEMGVSPSGTVQVTLASETAGSSVTMKAGSFLRYREVA